VDLQLPTATARPDRTRIGTFGHDHDAPQWIGTPDAVTERTLGENQPAQLQS
jgi:hypothetical protein